MGIHEVILNLCYVQDEEGIIYSLRAKAYVAERFSLRSRFGNLMKRFSDALNQTIFSESEGRDSFVVEMAVMKTMAQSEAEAGALLEVLPIKIK
ncbi:MAG: hypothetical protein MUP41_01515 [Desulfobacterales bacterium]|nr:hypothetical protein [Desulfobacterales bacterium]